MDDLTFYPAHPPVDNAGYLILEITGLDQG